MKILPKKEMYSLYFEDPKASKVERILSGVKLEYYYYSETINIKLNKKEVCNICILKGSALLIENNNEFKLNQFDMVYIPSDYELSIIPRSNNLFNNKICIMRTNLIEEPKKSTYRNMEIKKFSFNEFVSRGEFGDETKICTYREVWTAIRNGVFFSGFTNIPEESRVQGAITSINLEKDTTNKVKIYPHVHPEYPEVYIFCIDDNKGKVAITQFLINSDGHSICKDMIDGDGLFFPGNVGHPNFIRPTYKKLKYCMYMWIIPTFGKTIDIIPKTLNIE
ncbi:MAG: hypothetical protein ACTSRP_00535 [Candidatus Helarchaeota archaeon]